MVYPYFLVALLVTTCATQSTFSPARPPAIPLAVRSPYLSTWQAAGSDGGNGGYLAGQWPTMWSGAVTGWTGLIRVDSTVYTWMGLPKPMPTAVNQTSFSYTSTRSIFTMQAGPVSLNVTFLSPVTPDDLLRQSMPITYLTVEVQSADGQEHDVQLYTDVSAEWASGDRAQTAQWDYGVTGQQSSSSSKREAGPEHHWWHYGPEWHRRRPDPASASFSDPTATSTCSETDSATSGPVASGFATSTTAASKNGESLSGTATGTSATQSGVSSQAPASILPDNSTTGASLSTSVEPTGTASAGGIAYHKFWRQLQQEFSEDVQQASWGYWYYATENVESLSYQSGPDVDVRDQFTSSGGLKNTKDTDFRAILDNFPVFGFAIDLGSVGSEAVDTVFTINLAQENAVQFNGANGPEPLSSYWTNSYSDDLSALCFFFDDYELVSGMCVDIDNKVASDSAAVSNDYLTLTSLAVRQAFNAITVVGSGTTPYVFLKEVSSNGDVQTVDVIFPTMPIFLYTNPILLKLLLDPIYEYTAAGHFTQGTYALHDLGFFPNATTAGNETQPVEECGNMLIMTLAYAQRSGDTGYLTQHYDVLKQWTEYLVEDSLIPSNQISTDDFAGSLANQTNLALKGMIGIQAFAIIANMTGHAADGANFSSIAEDYIVQWQTLGIAHDSSPPHTTLAYGMNDTEGLLYNLYADALLQTELVPNEVYQMQSDFYPTIASTYGVALDTRGSLTKSDWEIFTAAIAATETRDLLIGSVAKWINETPTNAPATDLYDTETGDFATNLAHFIDRPVVGGWFALLALNHTGIPGNQAA